MSYILLKDVDFSIKGDKVEPVIITGLESLSRNSEVDKLLLFFQDMSIVATLPPEVVSRLKVNEVMAIFGTARSVDYEKFTKTEEQVQEEQAELQARALEMQNAAEQNTAKNNATEANMIKQQG